MRGEHSLFRVSSFDQSNASRDGSDEHAEIEDTALQERDGGERNSGYDSKDSNGGSFHSSMSWVLAAFGSAPDGTV